MRAIRSSLSTGLAIASLLALAGCGGAPTLVGAAHAASSLRAKDATASASWQAPQPLISFNDPAVADGLDAFAVDSQSNPFVAPLNPEIWSKGGADPQTRTQRVMELIAPDDGSTKPHRGTFLKMMDGIGTLVSDGDKAPARHLRVTFSWGASQATVTKDSPLNAVIFVVARGASADAAQNVAFGYVRTAPVLSAAPNGGNNAPVFLPPMKLQNVDGNQIPLMLMEVPEAGQSAAACSAQTRAAMKLDAVDRQQFSSDFHAAYPAAGAASEGGDTVNTDMWAITAAGYMAQIPAGTCAQSIFGDVSYQLGQ